MLNTSFDRNRGALLICSPLLFPSFLFYLFFSREILAINQMQREGGGEDREREIEFEREASRNKCSCRLARSLWFSVQLARTTDTQNPKTVPQLFLFTLFCPSPHNVYFRVIGQLLHLCLCVFILYFMVFAQIPIAFIFFKNFN